MIQLIDLQTSTYGDEIVFSKAQGGGLRSGGKGRKQNKGSKDEYK